MRDEGQSIEEIAGRIKKSPEHVERIIEWTGLDRPGEASRKSAEAMERRVLTMRREGESYEDIAGRFRRSPDFIRRVEGMAHYRKGVALLVDD